jgi:hypothetical protein
MDDSLKHLRTYQTVCTTAEVLDRALVARLLCGGQGKEVGPASGEPLLVACEHARCL